MVAEGGMRLRTMEDVGLLLALLGFTTRMADCEEREWRLWMVEDEAEEEDEAAAAAAASWREMSW